MPPRTSAGPLDGARSVLFIGSEALPFSKTGGLGDVLGALPKALGRLGWKVTLAIPRYRGVTAGDPIGRFPVIVGGYAADVRFFDAALGHGARALLVDEPALYDREQMYAGRSGDYPDNPLRFAVLVRAALEFAARQEPPPAVVHAHDWQAGLAPVYLRSLYAAHPVLGGLPAVFTIHNLAYQGIFAPDWLPRLDLSPDQLATERMEFWGRISFLKGGINDADVITTVSPRYAQEIQTPEGGAGFDGILRRRSADLVPILNGIDVEQWDPRRDPYLAKPFSAEDLSGKRACKARALAAFGLPQDEAALARPLIGMISRMIEQKGLDLIAALRDELVRLDASFVVLGTGDPWYEDMWRDLATRHPSRIGARIGFGEELAHVIEGGADMFLMPSRFEPCGLNQMYSLRYGTVPIVRYVGGLADTVSDPDGLRHMSDTRPTLHDLRSLGETDLTRQTGFVFLEYSPQALLEAVHRALAAFTDRRKWQAIQFAGMQLDHSWDRSAREYVKIYERAIDRAQSAGAEGRRPQG
jgi:starch synthase